MFALLAKKLAQHDHNVWVITNKTISEYHVHKNIRIVSVPPTRDPHLSARLGFLDDWIHTACSVFVGIKVIKKEGIDVIHSNTLRLAITGSMLSLLTSVPHIMTIHSIASLYMPYHQQRQIIRTKTPIPHSIRGFLTHPLQYLSRRYGRISYLFWAWVRFGQKNILRMRHECTHTVSYAIKKDLERMGERRPVFVIPNWIEPVSTGNTRVNPHRLVCIARLALEKNILVIIRAVDIVRKTIPQVRLTIVGDGPCKEGLERMITEMKLESNVEITGYRNDLECARIMSECAALLLPSIVEGLPLVVLEAFHHKKPALVANTEITRDIVREGVTGHVIDPYSDRAWADCILNMINDGTCQDMGRNGNAFLKSNHDPELAYQRILQMYSSVT